MARIETFSIDDYCYEILSKEKNKSKYVREAIKSYFGVEILPSAMKILRRLNNDTNFESELIEFVKRMTAILEGRR